MNNFLLTLGALLVGILAALVAVPMLVDWNSYRGVFEEEASRLLGRDVRVGGGVNLRILPVPFVRFEKLRIADTTSTGGDPLFRADSVTMQLSVAPLLKGVLEARSIELKRPMLRLAVDAEGRANWRSLTLQAGNLPFVPADVALQSVGIEDGQLVLAGSGTKNIAEINGIKGELSADSFDGPYKFKGTANWDGSPREIKASTARPEADGTLRLRTSVFAPESGATTTFDGRLLDLKGKPRFDGDLAAKFRVAAASDGPAKPAPADDPNLMDFKAKVSGTMKGGELKEIELSRDDPADPQIVSGSARAGWDNAVKVDLALAAKSFNLDRLSGTPPATPQAAAVAADPVQTARTALAVALGALPADAETTATFKAERATLNGEALSNVSLNVARTGGDLEIRSLTAGLPGGTRLLASGTLTKDPRQPSFNGPISFRGTNLARFVAWARKASAADAALLSRYDGPFALEGQLAMTGSLLELTRATAELSGRAISGEVRYNAQGRRKLGIVLDGDRIEAAQLLPGGFDPAALKAYMTGGAPGKTASTGFYGYDPATTDLTLTVRAGELLLTPTWTLREVDTNLSVSSGKLTVSRLRCETEEGLGIDADGTLAGLTQDPGKPAAEPVRPHGTVRWIVDAAKPEAVAALVSAIDWPAANRPTDATIKAITALGPVHLAGSTVLGGRSPTALDVTVDGMVDTGRVTGHARLDSGLNGWSAAPLDLAADVETADTSRWLALASLAPAVSATSSNRPGHLVLTAIGTPRSGLATFAELKSADTAISANGRATVSDAGELAFEGTSAITARDAADVLALAGLSLGQGPAGLPFNGSVRVNRNAAALALDVAAAKLGPYTVTAKANLKPDTARPGIRALAADVAIDTLSVPSLAAAMSDRRQQQDQPPAAGLWPEQPLRLPQNLSGRIDVKANRFVLDGAASAEKASATVRFEPDGVAIENLTASALGGKLNATFALKPEAAALALSGTLTLADANLSGLAPTASAPLSATIKLKGTGLSAAAIVASMTGTGEANLGAGQIKGVAPAGIAGLVDTALASKDPITGDALSDALRQSLAASTLALQPVKIPLSVTYGSARLQQLAVKAPEGRTTLDGSIDLSTLKFALDWRITADSKPSPSGTMKPPLTPLQFTAQGPLSGLPGAETNLALGSFEQDLVVRRMEHDTEELERLRKADEERRRAEEADRLKREEAERQKAAEAAAAAAAKAQSPPQQGVDMPDAAPASDAPLQGSTPPAPQGQTVPAPTSPQAEAPPVVPPAPTPAVRRRPPAPPQASGIPQPFPNY